MGAIDNQQHIDPVCGMKVDPHKAAATVCHQGHQVYFCADACRRSFETNPDKYPLMDRPKRKNFWQRYLDRLNRATGGQPPACH